ARLVGSLPRWGTLSLQGGLQQQDSGGQFQLGSTLTPTREEIRNLWSEARHEGTFADHWSTMVSVGASHGAPGPDDRLYATGDATSYYTRNFFYTAFDGKALLAYTLPRLRVSAGVDATHEDHGTLFYTRHFLEAQGTFMPGDSVDLLPPDGGVRSVT